MPADPPLAVRTSERAGRDQPSEDRIHRTGNAVIVLDGATQPTPLSRTGGWLADQLGQQLTARLEAQPASPLDAILASAIRQLADDHGLVSRSAPTTTVNIVRWTPGHVDVLVLCDSPVVVLDTSGRVHHVRDDRLKRVTRHPTASDPLAHARNQPNGFWVAGTTPAAAQHAIQERFNLCDIDVILAMTDGVAAGVDRYQHPPTWEKAIALARTDPAHLVDLVHQAETTDPDTSRWPRSKPHDDKALAVITT
jgi:hypothetical protein